MWVGCLIQVATPTYAPLPSNFIPPCASPARATLLILQKSCTSKDCVTYKCITPCSPEETRERENRGKLKNSDMYTPTKKKKAPGIRNMVA